MSAPAYVQTLDLICGALLLSTVLMLWRRELSAMIRLLAAQGALLAMLAALLGAHEHSVELYAVAGGVLLLKAVVLPTVLRRVLHNSGELRDATPLVNVPASMVAATLLTLLAYAVSRPIVELAPSPATHAIPISLAVLFVGFFILVTRRRALSQLVGFFVLDNGIAATSFLATGGVPLIVELGASLDLLLILLVLQILTARLHLAFGSTDLDELRELRD